MRRNKDPAPMEKQSVREAPRLLQVAGSQLLPKEDRVGSGRRRPANLGEETERRPGADAQGRPGGLVGGGSKVGVATGQCVGHDVKTAGRYLTEKSKPKSLLIHWCCGTVDNHWSSKNFKL